MARYVVSKDWRITIPAEMRRRLDLKPGDLLSVQSKDDHIVLTPVRSDSRPSSTSKGRSDASPLPVEGQPD